MLQLIIKTNTNLSILKFDTTFLSQFFILENSSNHKKIMSMINQTYVEATFVQFLPL